LNLCNASLKVLQAFFKFDISSDDGSGLKEEARSDMLSVGDKGGDWRLMSTERDSIVALV
jgi:hypothetical protein